MSIEKNNIHIHDILNDLYGGIQTEEVDDFRLRYRQPVTRIWKTDVIENKAEIAFEEDIDVFKWIVVGRMACMWAIYKQGSEIKRPIYAYYNKEHIVMEQGVNRYWLSKLFNLKTPMIIVDHYASLSDSDDTKLKSYNWQDVTSEYSVSFKHKKDWYKGKDVLWPVINIEGQELSYNDKFDSQIEEEEWTELYHEFIYEFEAKGKEYRFIYPDSKTHYLTPTKINSRATYYVSNLGNMFQIILKDFESN